MLIDLRRSSFNFNPHVNPLKISILKYFIVNWYFVYFKSNDFRKINNIYFHPGEDVNGPVVGGG